MRTAPLLAYSMTKGGIHAFTHLIAGSLIDKGVRVNFVPLGPVWTSLDPPTKRPTMSAGRLEGANEAAVARGIAPAYVSIASPQMSSYITGEVLPIIGGYGGS